MDNREIAKYNCFTAIRGYGAAHTDKFPPESFAAGLFTRMGQVIAKIEQLGGTQLSLSGGTRQSTSSKALARSALTATLDAMNLAANAMARDIPGLEDKFRRPRDKTAQALLNVAQAFLEDAKPLKAEFMKYGMPEDFLDELASQISDFKQAASEHHTHSQASVSSTVELDAAIEEGLGIRHHLNAAVRITLRRDRALLAAWESASHISHSSRKQQGAAPNPPVETPAPTGTPGGGSETPK